MPSIWISGGYTDHSKPPSTVLLILMAFYGSLCRLRWLSWMKNWALFCVVLDAVMAIEGEES